MPRTGLCPAACGQVHSYTSDLVRWCWLHATRGVHALDVELNSAPPALIRRQFDGTDREFWRAWTGLEVTAKLTDVPALTLLRNGELHHPRLRGLKLRHYEIHNAIVCLGERF